MMFTHDDIWNAIDALADANGLSTSGLAKEAGLDPTTFNKSKRQTAEGKLRWPSTESLSKILFITQTSLDDFLSIINERRIHTSDWEVPAFDEKDLNPDFLTAVKQGHKDRLLLFPNGRDHVVSIEIQSDIFAPDYPKGTLLLIDTQPNIRRNDHVIICIGNNHYYNGLIQKETAGKITLNPDTEFDKNDIHWMARILWASQ